MKYARFACAGVIIALAGYAVLPDRKAAGQNAKPLVQEPYVGPPRFVPGDNYVHPLSQPFGFGPKAPNADPELAKLFAGEAQAEREAADLTRAYSHTDKEDERAKIKPKLAEALGKQFDWQQKRRELELERLDAQTKRLRDLMKKRGEALTTIVEKRQDQLLREADGLGWTPPPGLSAAQSGANNKGSYYLAPIVTAVPMFGGPANIGMRPPGPDGDPELLKLLTDEGRAEREAAALVKDYARSDKDADRAKIKTKLTAVLEKQFDVQQKRRDAELTRMETQLKKLHDLMKKRSDVRKTIVESRLDQIIREADGLGWTPPPAPPAQKLPTESSIPQAR